MFINRWMDKEDVVHIYNGISLSHKKEWNNAICSNIDVPRDCHIEWSKSNRERQILHNMAYMRNLIMIQMNLFTKQKQTHRLIEWTYGYQEGRVGGGIVREFETDMHTMLYLKWIPNKDLLYSTGNSAQYYVTI